MERAIKDWLEDLEEPYRSEALENYNPNYYEWMGSPEVDNVVDALGFAFWWKASPQGQDYWNELAESLEKNNPQTFISEVYGLNLSSPKEQ